MRNVFFLIIGFLFFLYFRSLVYWYKIIRKIANFILFLCQYKSWIHSCEKLFGFVKIVLFSTSILYISVAKWSKVPVFQPVSSISNQPVLNLTWSDPRMRKKKFSSLSKGQWFYLSTLVSPTIPKLTISTWMKESWLPNSMHGKILTVGKWTDELSHTCIRICLGGVKSWTVSSTMLTF